MKSSLIYEILLQLNTLYFIVFAFCEFGTCIFKAFTLPSPRGTAVSEFAIIFFLCIVECLRVYLGRKGNLLEKALPVVVSNLLTVPATLGVVYCLLWQSYVLRLDFIVCSIQLVFLSAEFTFSSLCLLAIYK